MKTRPLAQRRQLLEQKVAQRKDIQAKMAALETKRNAYLRAQADKSGAKNGFDQKMLDTFKRQASKNGFRY